MTSLDGVMVGSYDYLLVVLSALIAVLASYSALDLAERVTAARGTVRLAWLITGSAAMGIGIWSIPAAFNRQVAMYLAKRVGGRSLTKTSTNRVPRNSAN